MARHDGGSGVCLRSGGINSIRGRFLVAEAMLQLGLSESIAGLKAGPPAKRFLETRKSATHGSHRHVLEPCDRPVLEALSEQFTDPEGVARQLRVLLRQPGPPSA